MAGFEMTKYTFTAKLALAFFFYHVALALRELYLPPKMQYDFCNYV